MSTTPADQRLLMEAAISRHPSGHGVVLSNADRCDRCGAAAGYRVARPDHVGGELDFCVHHWRKHFPGMVSMGWAIVGSNPEVIQS